MKSILGGAMNKKRTVHFLLCLISTFSIPIHAHTLLEAPAAEENREVNQSKREPWRAKLIRLSSKLGCIPQFHVSQKLDPEFMQGERKVDQERKLNTFLAELEKAIDRGAFADREVRFASIDEKMEITAGASIVLDLDAKADDITALLTKFPTKEKLAEEQKQSRQKWRALQLRTEQIAKDTGIEIMGGDPEMPMEIFDRLEKALKSADLSKLHLQQVVVYSPDSKSLASKENRYKDGQLSVSYADQDFKELLAQVSPSYGVQLAALKSVPGDAVKNTIADLTKKDTAARLKREMIKLDAEAMFIGEKLGVDIRAYPRQETDSALAATRRYLADLAKVDPKRLVKGKRGSLVISEDDPKPSEFDSSVSVGPETSIEKTVERLNAREDAAPYERVAKEVEALEYKLSQRLGTCVATIHGVRAEDSLAVLKILDEESKNAPKVDSVLKSPLERIAVSHSKRDEVMAFEDLILFSELKLFSKSPPGEMRSTLKKILKP